LAPEIQAKLASYRRGQQPQRLTLEEIRTVVRAIRVQLLLEPDQAPDLEVSLKRFVGLVRMRRRQDARR
jgi:hypothetical protein